MGTAFLRRHHISHSHVLSIFTDMKESIKSYETPIQYQLIRTKIVSVIAYSIEYNKIETFEHLSTGYNNIDQ